MPVPTIHHLLRDTPIQVFNPVLGTPAGTKTTINCPVRGYVTEVGYCVNSIVTSAMTLAVTLFDNTVSSTASTSTQFVTSTLGTASSTNLFEGATFSVVVPSPQIVNAGDCLQFATSGGQTSLVGGTVYAIIKRT